MRSQLQKESSEQFSLFSWLNVICFSTSVISSPFFLFWPDDKQKLNNRLKYIYHTRKIRIERGFFSINIPSVRSTVHKLIENYNEKTVRADTQSRRFRSENTVNNKQQQINKIARISCSYSSLAFPLQIEHAEVTSSTARSSSTTITISKRFYIFPPSWRKILDSSHSA